MKSKILIIGVTGSLGFDLAKASVQASHPTYGLVRDSAFSEPNKSQKLQILSDAGVTLLKGSLQDEESLVEAIKQVDVVICSIPSKLVLDQKLLVQAIKRAGCIKRFIPSEFGSDPDKTRVSDLDYNFYSRKAEIRRLIEAEHIPYTYICCNFFMRYLLPSLVQPGLKSPPREKVTIYGDGTIKGVFVRQSDVAAFTIRTVDDPRTLNMALHLRPPGNVYSMNELVEIWETKIGKELQKTYISEEELLIKIKETPYPDNMELVFVYSAFVKGDQTYFDIESSGRVEGMQLYPQLLYTTISDRNCLLKASNGKRLEVLQLKFLRLWMGVLPVTSALNYRLQYVILIKIRKMLFLQLFPIASSSNNPLEVWGSYLFPFTF